MTDKTVKELAKELFPPEKMKKIKAEMDKIYKEVYESDHLQEIGRTHGEETREGAARMISAMQLMKSKIDFDEGGE